MGSEYTPEIAKEILDKFNDKGWNFYDTSDRTLCREEVIKNNLVEFLELGGKYILLPVADNPRDPEQVMNALEILARKLNKELPTIKVNHSNYPLTGITLGNSRVALHTPDGTQVTYSDLIDAMDSVVKTN